MRAPIAGLLLLLTASLSLAGGPEMLLMAVSDPLPEASHFNNPSKDGWVESGNVWFSFGTGYGGTGDDGLTATMSNTQYITLTKTVEMTRAGSMKFWTKNSFGYAYVLTLTVDGVAAEVEGLQGTGWEQLTVPLAEGTHELVFATPLTTGYTLWLDEITFH